MSSLNVLDNSLQLNFLCTIVKAELWQTYVAQQTTQTSFWFLPRLTSYLIQLLLLISKIKWSQSFASLTHMSSFTTPINLLLGLSCLPVPTTASFYQYICCPSVHDQTILVWSLWPLSANRPLCSVPLMYRFLILSILVTSNLPLPSSTFS